MRSPLSGSLFGRSGDRRVALVVLGGAFLSVTAVYVVVVLGGGLLIGHTDSPHVGLSILATAIVALGLEPLRSWLEGSGEALGAGGPGHAVRRAQPVHRVAHRRDRAGRTSSSRCGWRACSPRAPGRGGPRSGSWSTANRSSRPPGQRKPGPRQHEGGRRRARSAIARRHARRRAARRPAAPGAPRPAAVAGRGAPVRRSRGPGGPGASRCRAARRPGEAGRGPGDAGRGPPGVAPTCRRRP